MLLPKADELVEIKAEPHAVEFACEEEQEKENHGQGESQVRLVLAVFDVPLGELLLLVRFVDFVRRQFYRLGN